MAYVRGLKLEASPETLGREFEDFVKAASFQSEQLLAISPSDARLKVTVTKLRHEFQVVATLEAHELAASARAEAKSPFVALETALLGIRETVNVWSVTKAQGMGYKHEQGGI